MSLNKTHKQHNTAHTTNQSDAGYVTIEAAFVISALVIVSLALVTGLMFMSAQASAVTTARNAARYASLGASAHEVEQIVRQSHQQASVQITEYSNGDQSTADIPSTLLRIEVQYPSPFHPITVSLVTVKEPEE